MIRLTLNLVAVRWPWWPAFFYVFLVGFSTGVCSQVLPYQPTELNLAKSPDQVFARHELFMGSNFISLKEFNNITQERFNTDPGGFAPQTNVNLALLKSHFEMGLIRGDSSFSLLHRLDAYSNVSEGMARLAYANKMGMRIPAGSVLNLRAEVQGHEFIGMKWGHSLYRYSDETHRVGFSGWVSALYGLQFAQLNGTGQLSSTYFNYYYDATLSQYSSSRTYPYISQEQTSGIGFSTGLHISYEHRTSGRLTLVLNDLYSQVNWKHLPYSEAALIFNRAKFNPQGYLIFDPALLGQNDLNRRGFRQRLPIQTTLIYTQNFHRLGASVGWQDDRNLSIPFAGVSWKFQNAQEISYQHDFQFNGHQLGWRNDRWKLRVGWSQLPLSQTKMLATQLHYIRPW